MTSTSCNNFHSDAVKVLCISPVSPRLPPYNRTICVAEIPRRIPPRRGNAPRYIALTKHHVEHSRIARCSRFYLITRARRIITRALTHASGLNPTSVGRDVRAARRRDARRAESATRDDKDSRHPRHRSRTNFNSLAQKPRYYRREPARARARACPLVCVGGYSSGFTIGAMAAFFFPSLFHPRNDF